MVSRGKNGDMSCQKKIQNISFNYIEKKSVIYRRFEFVRVEYDLFFGEYEVNLQRIEDEAYFFDWRNDGRR